MRIDPTSFQAALALERGRVVLASGDFAIPLTAKRPGGRHGGWDGTCAVVSPEDKDLSRFSWSVDRNGYARRRMPPNSSARMHRETKGQRKFNLGNFATEQEAADAAKAWRREHLPFSHEEGD